MSFGDDVRRFARKADKRVVHAMQYAAGRTFAGVIDDTPQDTGYAAGNWQQGDHDSQVDRSPAAAKADAIQAAERWTLAAPLRMTNPAPYIFSLEYGDAKHRPAGMVRGGQKQFKKHLRAGVSDAKGRYR